MRRGKDGKEKRSFTHRKTADGGDHAVLTDYGGYRFGAGEIAVILLKYNALFLLIAKLFYDFLPAFALGNFLMPLLFRREAAIMAKKRQEILRTTFREFILSFGNSLRAGYSIENAFVSAYQDMQYLYETENIFLAECRRIIGQMKNNQNLEELFLEFAKRSRVRDIRDFAVVFKAAKKSGGNLSQIIQDSAQVISDKIGVKEEIAVLIAAKKMEQSVMNIVPLGLMLYLSVTSRGYFDALYKNPAGVIIMSACLLLYLASFLIAEKITTIEMDG